jgi:hypothetical protein
MWHSAELSKFELVLWADLDEGALVACAVAVVRGGEDGDALSVVLDFVTFHSDLVRTDDGFEVVGLAEALSDVGPELETYTTLAGTAAGLRLGVCPEHFHHEARLAGLPLLEAVQLPHVIESDLVIGKQTAVQDEVLLANQRCKGQGRERFREEFEDALVVFGTALALEAVHSVHVVRLMIATVEEELGRVQPLVSIEKQRNLCRPGASVDKVAVEEEHVLVRRLASETEDLHEIKVLTCSISLDDGSRNF